MYSKTFEKFLHCLLNWRLRSLVARACRLKKISLNFSRFHIKVARQKFRFQVLHQGPLLKVQNLERGSHHVERWHLAFQKSSNLREGLCCKQKIKASAQIKQRVKYFEEVIVAFHSAWKGVRKNCTAFVSAQRLFHLLKLDLLLLDL